MENPTSLINQNGTRTANVKWNITIAEEYNVALKIKKLATTCEIDLVNISVKKVGLFKDNDEVSFKVHGIESKLYIFLNALEKGIEKLNSQIEEEYNPPKKPGFIKKLFGK